jgi:hypothetical protein
VRCPACRTAQAVDLRTLDRHPGAAVTSLTHRRRRVARADRTRRSRSSCACLGSASQMRGAWIARAGFSGNVRGPAAMLAPVAYGPITQLVSVTCR